MNRRGLSLLEILIAVALSAGALYFGATLLRGANKQLTQSGEKFTVKTLLNVVSGSLQKYMASGDLRFLAFVGTASPQRPMIRAMAPLIGKCGDMTTLGCEEDVSFLYVHYDKLTTPTVTAICNDTLPNSGNGYTGRWVVDLNNKVYGAASVVGEGFDVASSSSSVHVAGLVRVKNDQALALMNPPYASLWVGQGAPTLLTGIANDGTGLPAGDCVKNLQPDPGQPGKFLVDKLYLVPYKPMIFSQFTNGTSANITDSMLQTGQGIFPLRIFSASFRSIGRRKLPSGQYEVAMSECSQTGMNVACTGKAIATIPGFTKMRIEEIYHVRPKDSAAERFHLGSAAQTVLASCTEPTCAKLPVDAPPIPVLASSTETFENLSGAKFSFLKHEALQKLRFILVGTNGKEETFDIIFP